MKSTRRQFLADVGKGMLAASVGADLAIDMGFGSLQAKESSNELTFGELEPLVELLQETPPGKLLPLLTERWQKGTELKELVAAAALANVRTFGGEDYIGFHTMMAMMPAYHMARELPKDRSPLPVFKVLYRNTNRLQEKGGRKHEVLHPVTASETDSTLPGIAMREAVRRQDLQSAESLFAGVAHQSAEDAFNNLLYVVEDGTEVHRVVMAYRAWDLLDLVGKERAHTVLRQSVHYCVQSEQRPEYFMESRALLPKLLDQYHLADKKPGQRIPDDAWVDQMSQTFFKSTPAQAADAAAAALAEGIAPDAIGEAISLTANQLVLRDNGRPQNQTSPGKPVGSVHGDGIGVHASDSANAWRNIARVSNARNTFACLILGAYQVARDRSNRGGDFLNWEPYPRAEARAKVKAKDESTLLREMEEAIRVKEQALACALVGRYGEL
ncbi:MAG TPA: hypothetical protein VGZ47_03635, partial [Gemmataceae bacterium]|nr:hypothetical protein [Gemmataceae bacterium]